ncbi:MAG: PA14 domain-containing protein [Nocardioidaceae bacterium]
MAHDSRLIRALLIALGLVLLTGTVGRAGAAEPPTADGMSGLSVVGNQLYEDGAPFLPRGFNMIGALTPSWCTRSLGVAARTHFGQAELDAAKGWDANTVRLQVSQRGLADPAVAQSDRDAYVQQIVADVTLAESNGFVVDLSMQDQGIGCGQAHPLPTSMTSDAWTVLAPQFANDTDVMYELFNEPAVHNTLAGAWGQWQSGGSSPSSNLGSPAVGEQALVDQIRGLGASNVLIADGLDHAERLDGVPMLSDALGQLMYGVHPYVYDGGQSTWDTKFGYLTSTVPVIATEWNFKPGDCGTSTAALTPAFFGYLHDHDVGLLGHAFDVPGTLITNDWSWTPTDCATAQKGAGQVLKDYFAGQADPPPLGAPQQLTGSANGPAEIDLSWQPGQGTETATGYQVWRDGSLIASTSDPAYNDTSVDPNTTYSYTVVAVDIAGDTSAPSNAVTLSTPPLPGQDTQPPTAPTGAAARVVSPSDVQLTWNASTDNVGVTDYEVVRDGAVIDTLDALSYDDTAMSSAHSHIYVVYALDAAGNVSPVSNSAKAIVPAAVPSGLTGKYYDTAAFSSLKVTRTDAGVDFDWGTGSPSPKLGVDTFSVRWTGKVMVPASGTYAFSTQTDEGVRLWVNGRQIINDWTAHTLRQDSGTISLAANQAYTLRMDYYEKTGPAKAVLLWSDPSMPQQVIPASQLLVR